jgi:hypothetical protein
MSKKSKSLTKKIENLTLETARARAAATAANERLAALAAPANTTATAAAAPPPSLREQLAALPHGSVARASFLLEHQREILAEADTPDRFGRASHDGGFGPRAA